MDWSHTDCAAETTNEEGRSSVTSTDHRTSATAGDTSPRSRAAVIGVAVFALVVGLTAGRFLTYRPEASATAPPPPAAVTLVDRMDELERRVAQDPQDLAGWQQLGITAVQRAAESADPAFYGLAERAFDKADELRAGDPQTLLGRGSLALALHDFDTALDIGRQAVAALPANGAALGIVVDAQVELGQYDDAAQTLQLMLDASPDLPALARASYLRELHGDLEGAGQAMRQAQLAGSPAPFDQASVMALRGNLALADNDTAAAAAVFAEALELVPGLVAAEIGMARIEAIRGNAEAAVARLQVLVDRVPHPEAAALLADLQLRQGDTRAAADTDEIVRSLAALQEAQGQVVDLEMALFEADRGDDPQRAVRLARRAFDARPDNVFTADALAWSLHRAGDSQAAVPHARRALRLGTADALLHYHAAEIFAAAGKRQAAVRELRAAMSLTPWFSFGAVDDAAALAQRLDVEVPASWQQA